MKLLFDENLSFRPCQTIADIFTESEQVVRAGLERSNDAAVWRYAKRGDFLIVTLDSDFAEMAALLEPPPKVLWLRCGNRPTDYVARLLRDRAGDIASFAGDASASCLELY